MLAKDCPVPGALLQFLAPGAKLESIAKAPIEIDHVSRKGKKKSVLHTFSSEKTSVDLSQFQVPHAFKKVEFTPAAVLNLPADDLGDLSKIMYQSNFNTPGGTNGDVSIVIGAVPGAPKGSVQPAGAALYNGLATAKTPPIDFSALAGGSIQINNAGAANLVQINGIKGGKVIFNTGKLDPSYIQINSGVTGEVFETSFGSVSVRAGSLALIMAQPGGTAIYNLDDNSKDSVVVSVGKQRISLAPGRHVLITSRLVESFELVNPSDCFAYRNLSSKKLDGELQAFTAEFSVPLAVAAVKPLQKLVLAQDEKTKRLSAHLLKTAAILSQLPGAPYQQYPHPRLTARAGAPVNRCLSAVDRQ